MVPRALQAADRLAEKGISCKVIDIRTLVPLDTQTILSAVSDTGRLFTVEENPRLCGWGAEISSIVSEECFYDLDGADHPHHHAAYSAAVRRQPGGSGAAIGRTDRGNRARQHGLRARWTS